MVKSFMQQLKKVPLVGGALVDELLSKIAETARQKLSMPFGMVSTQVKQIRK